MDITDKDLIKTFEKILALIVRLENKHIGNAKELREELNKATEDLRGKTNDNLTSIKEELLNSIPEPIVGERGADGVRGNKFLGSFNTKKDLPEIDGVNVIEGDYAYIDDTGTIWYA